MALWRPGETVYLNSGSPALKVIGTTDGGEVEVTWNRDERTIERSSFPAACLTRLENSDVGR